MNLLPVAQPIPATPPAHGLLVTADEATDLPYEAPSIAAGDDPRTANRDRWGVGFVVQPENCVQASAWEPDCEFWPAGNADGTKTYTKSLAPTNETSYVVSPVVLETSFLCDAAGFTRVDYRGRARRQMEASTSKAMEYELATGALNQAGSATNPFLEDNASVVALDAGSVYSPQDALARLGAALSGCGHGGRGVIHAPTIWVDRLLDDGSNNVAEVGNRLVTRNRGDRIVSGTGYRGYGPGGAAPAAGEVWVYATGPVQYRLSDIMVFPDSLAEALDRKKNNIEYRAERACAMNFDPCCHFAIRSRVFAALA